MNISTRIGAAIIGGMTIFPATSSNAEDCGFVKLMYEGHASGCRQGNSADCANADATLGRYPQCFSALRKELKKKPTGLCNPDKFYQRKLSGRSCTSINYEVENVRKNTLRYNFSIKNTCAYPITAELNFKAGSPIYAKSSIKPGATQMTYSQCSKSLGEPRNDPCQNPLFKAFETCEPRDRFPESGHQYSDAQMYNEIQVVASQPRDFEDDDTQCEPDVALSAQNVQNAQIALKDLNYYTDYSDGKIGARTRKAIQKFNNDFREQDCDTLSPETLSMLREALDGKIGGSNLTLGGMFACNAAGIDDAIQCRDHLVQTKASSSAVGYHERELTFLGEEFVKIFLWPDIDDFVDIGSEVGRKLIVLADVLNYSYTVLKRHGTVFYDRTVGRVISSYIERGDLAGAKRYCGNHMDSKWCRELMDVNELPAQPLNLP